MDITDIINYDYLYENCNIYMETKDIKSLIDIFTQFDKNSLNESSKYLFELLNPKRKIFPIKTIKIHDIFYRARYGFNKEKGAIDDCDIDVTTPFFGDDISEPPTMLAKSGRFNPAGISYLYISSDLETCISELKLDVGQTCSIGKFECKKEWQYIDFSNEYSDKFFNILKKILLFPVNNDNSNYYLLTQTLAKVFKRMHYRGICYPSPQTYSKNSFNLVCFEPSDFSFIDYSDELYTIKSVHYLFEKEEESYRKYIDYDKLLNSYNERDDLRKEKIFEYINLKTIHEQKHGRCKIKRETDFGTNK